MKKILLLTVFIILGTIACDKTEDGFELDFKCSDNINVCELADDNNAFGLELFRTLHRDKPEENIFISPFSISTALSMTVNGADGATKNQLIYALHYSAWQLDTLNKSYKSLLEVLPFLDDKVKMKVANSLWHRNEFEVNPDFITTNKNYYSSEVRKMDFSDPKTKDVINKWVENKTEGKIKDLIESIDNRAIMFIINAIYFKADWRYKFETKNTSEGNFNLENGQTVQTKMMSIEEITLPYLSNNAYRMIDIPYGDSIYSMSILLPNKHFKINDIVDDLYADNWKVNINNLSHKDLSLTMPKFKMKNKYYLKKTLKKLGIHDAFSSRADFSKINSSSNIFIDDVIHQSFIEVDEKGTEAAAATAVVFKNTSIGIREPFIINKPFVFVIRDRKTSSISFIGKVMNPNK